MNEFVIHANHNHRFYESICKDYPDHYFDWKNIALFYVAIHLLKALALHRKKDLGVHHFEINDNIRSGPHKPTMPISKTAYDNYMNLFHYSQSARYEGFKSPELFQAARKNDHEHACKCFRDFRKFIISSGVRLD
jgi:hypothetical protein